MHRSYQSTLPTHNRLLQKRWDQQYYNEHRQKVNTARSTVDTKAPKTYLHLHLKLKKLQLEEERLATIQRDNRILLEKISGILRTRGRIDNKNNVAYKSLNREKRQRELLRITKDNHDILRRILERKPEYDAKKWGKEWKQNLEFMDNISSFPDRWWIDNNTKKKRKTVLSRGKSEVEAKDKQEEKQSTSAGEAADQLTDNSSKEQSPPPVERGVTVA